MSSSSSSLIVGKGIKTLGGEGGGGGEMGLGDSLGDSMGESGFFEDAGACSTAGSSSKSRLVASASSSELSSDSVSGASRSGQIDG
jgi:hypothetical protein